MDAGIQQLDQEVGMLKSHRFAPSTRKFYSTRIKSYLSFCEQYNLPPLPATTDNIYRYIAFLAREKSYTTIQQYLSTVNLLHQEFGFPHPTQDNYSVHSLMKAVKHKVIVY